MMGSYRPKIVPDPVAISPGIATVGEFLDETEYADLYRLVSEEGLPYFVRLNDAGTVELFLVFESVEDFSEATSDAVSIEFKTYRQKLLAILWTLTDPQNPLGFPLTFDIDKDTDRFMALALIEQKETPVHYLCYTDRRILHIFSETITFSQEERKRVEGYIRRLYEKEQVEDMAAREEEIREGELTSIPASSLPDELLRQDGTVYRFQSFAPSEQNEQQELEAHLMNTLHQALLVVRRHARSEVRESKCTIWAGQDPKAISLYVTPDVTALFQDVAQGEADPFTRFFQEIPAFVESKAETPLIHGAYPILRYESGQLYHLELDESTTQRLRRLYAQFGLSDSSTNPYA